MPPPQLRRGANISKVQYLQILEKISAGHFMKTVSWRDQFEDPDHDMPIVMLDVVSILLLHISLAIHVLF